MGRSKSFGNGAMEAYVASKSEVDQLNEAMDRGAIAAEDTAPAAFVPPRLAKQDSYEDPPSPSNAGQVYHDPDWEEAPDAPPLMHQDSSVSILSMGGVSHYYAKDRERREQEAAARAAEREAKKKAEEKAEKERKKRELLMGGAAPPQLKRQLTKEEEEELERARFKSDFGVMDYDPADMMKQWELEGETDNRSASTDTRSGFSRQESTDTHGTTGTDATGASTKALGSENGSNSESQPVEPQPVEPQGEPPPATLKPFIRGAPAPAPTSGAAGTASKAAPSPSPKAKSGRTSPPRLDTVVSMEEKEFKNEFDFSYDPSAMIASWEKEPPPITKIR